MLSLKENGQLRKRGWAEAKPEASVPGTHNTRCYGSPTAYPTQAPFGLECVSFLYILVSGPGRKCFLCSSPSKIKCSVSATMSPPPGDADLPGVCLRE